MEIISQLIQKGVRIKLFLGCCWWHESVAGLVEILCVSQHSGSRCLPGGRSSCGTGMGDLEERINWESSAIFS
jgi:hypothetical protein